MLKVNNQQNSKSRTTLTGTATPSTADGNVRLLTWEQMYTNFQVKEKIIPSKQPIQRIQIIEDPIETASPLNQPNRFLFNDKLRQGFREYLSGKKTALRLVNECNHSLTKKDQRLKNKVKIIRRVNMFANQLQTGNKYKQFHQQGLSEAEIEKKVRVFQRFEKIKKLIQRNCTDESESNNNLKDIQLFKNLFEAGEDNKSRIKQKNLLADAANGRREYDNISYHSRGGLRVKKIETHYNEQGNLSDQSSLLKMKVREKVDKKLQLFKDEIIQQENEIHAKAKRKMVSKNTNYKEFNKNNINDPLNRDVRFYAYVFMKQKKKEIQMNSPSRLCNTTRHENKQKHFLQNFHNIQLMTNDSLSADSSLNSMLEINIDNLYRASNTLQNQIMSGDQEKFVKRIKQLQRVQQLNSEIIRVNELKLSTERKSMLV